MRESTIEQHAVAMFKALGDLPYKFTSPGRRNVPDRLRLCEIPAEHREIVARYVQFIEFKATGEKPTAAQEREHARLRKLGFRVEVVDNIAGVDALVRETWK
ncbi:VRR-NUC domain-containing protein [Achromobacter sp. SIMBA_011]|uniref:VRR-NUC domain-containing protein n=1 Tax=Achromobacter TaxID=222 RepID=UPI001EEF73F1|nr:VRR-NUC domain-containing protein [Achromobacter xylosoxidans]